MFPRQPLRDALLSTLSLFSLIALTFLSGCGGDSASGTTMVSPPGWVDVSSGGQHAVSATKSFIDNGTASCAACHGADLSGGTAGVSCFGNPSGCHHDPAEGWTAPSPAVQRHGAAAKTSPGGSGLASCRICHGNDFSGGGSQVSCFGCHGANSPHPRKPWRGSPYTHSTTEEEGNAEVCHTCHAFTGTANPNNPGIPAVPPPAGSAPGCFNGTMCHDGSVRDVPPENTAHEIPYFSSAHYAVTDAAFATNCRTCHAVEGASPVPDAPPCIACHTAGSPLSEGNCSSCHANPPGGPSTAYPDAAGVHGAHLALAGSGNAIGCDACHDGLGSRTLSHYLRADARPGKDAQRQPPGSVAFPSRFNAKSGAAAFEASSGTCSNVICHGGQTTPDWQTDVSDAIDVPAACPACHASGTTQYNSYFSGRHERHIERFGDSASTCRRCHDASRLNASAHFGNLSTRAFEQSASETILADLEYNGSFCFTKLGGIAGWLAGCHGKEKW